MVRSRHPPLDLAFHPLTPKYWTDFELLFGKKGAFGGCWCMWWRLSRAQFARRHGNRNRLAMKRIVDAGAIPGIIAYSGTVPIGWCSSGPRESFPALERSRVLKRVDDLPVWSIVCFFVTRPWRTKGVTVQLIEAAINYARKHGARVIEAYPFDPRKRQPDAFVWTGLASAFRQAGFIEVLRRSPARPIMRRYLKA